MGGLVAGALVAGGIVYTAVKVAKAIEKRNTGNNNIQFLIIIANFVNVNTFEREWLSPPPPSLTVRLARQWKFLRGQFFSRFMIHIIK